MTPKYSPLAVKLQDAFEADDPELAGKQMERGSVEAVKRITDSLGLGDLAALFADLDPDIELEIHAPAFFPFLRRAAGITEVQAAIVHNFSAVEEQDPQVLRVVAQGSVVDIVLSETGKIRATGRRYDIVALLQFVFRGHKVYRFFECIAPRTPEN